MVMDMGLLAVSIYQTRPKSKQELQITSFNPNATATAVEQPAATEFGPGGYEWSWTWDCWLSRSIKHGQNPSRSCRSPVSTRMLLLQRSNKAGHGAFAWHWRSSASSTSSQCNMFKSLVETVETPCPHEGCAK